MENEKICLGNPMLLSEQVQDLLHSADKVN